MIGDPDLIEPFLVEGRELVERGSADLDALTRAPGDAAHIGSLFRTLHTLKGSVGLFDLPALAALLHRAEGRLEVARGAGRLDDTPHIVEVFDIVDAWLDIIEAGRSAPNDLIARTQRAASANAEMGAASEVAVSDQDWARALAAGIDAAEALTAVRYRPSRDAYFRGDDPLACVRGLPGLVHLSLSAAAAEPANYDPFQCTLTVEALCAAPLGDVRAALKWVADEVELVVVESEFGGAVAARRTVRVDADQLDALAALVDELIAAKNSLQSETALLAGAAKTSGRQHVLNDARSRLDRVVADLHGGVTDLRLVEVSRLFGRFPRQIREIGAALGKDAELAISGAEVKLDKSVIDSLYGPILHLLRNAIDHGLEAVDRRAAVGKPVRAQLSLSARAAGSEIVIEVADDGAGLDLAQLRRAAADKGLLDPTAATDDEAAAALIFSPGFSTRAAVTDLSGRGVGMDSVRQTVDRLGGRIELDNRPGLGLTVRMILPAQVLLSRILTISASTQRFGVLIDAVAELHRVNRDEVQTLRSERAYVRRETVMPLLRLCDLLNLPGEPDPEAFPVLSIPVGPDRIGIQIDRLGERFDAPLRPFTGLLKGYPGLLGAVSEGDGGVLMVLDIAELAS